MQSTELEEIRPRCGCSLPWVYTGEVSTGPGDGDPKKEGAASGSVPWMGALVSRRGGDD